ncbi:DUF503 domain-containing protein [Thermoleophilum album]|jgi:uncharacterized protein YlxP (DUF503 family)|uniref:DUF503 domain-containing protein n=1 Tax=Thermoleophilum album TaxID=29539 RepID=UPI00237CB977|nr:DUF503 domain-containing protein [Thermoleophilum album]MCL6441182.1 DUF503 domain-containing protein [Thermoleophilum sp.]WDT92810.1 DUF503 domain-containing protein [Thermoleophilum album]
MGFVCLLEIEVHLPGNGSLKGKRRELSSLKANLQRRFGAAVAETDHHDLWQRATLSAALVGPDPGPVLATADRIERFLCERYPGTVHVARGIASRDDLLGG